jgi:hypothetical protein
MTGESRCNCQRCGKPIVFPIDLHNTDVECPHCRKSTTLRVPEPSLHGSSPSSRVRKGETPPVITSTPKTDYSIVGAVGLACSILIPFVGFFIGIYLLAKRQPARGCVCMAISIIAGLGWLILINS